MTNAQILQEHCKSSPSLVIFSDNLQWHHACYGIANIIRPSKQANRQVARSLVRKLPLESHFLNRFNAPVKIEHQPKTNYGKSTDQIPNRI
jgi:hypothetical protein